MKRFLSIMQSIGLMLLALLVQMVVGIIGGIFFSVISTFRLMSSGFTNPDEMVTSIMNSLVETNFIQYITVIALILEVVIFGLWYYKAYNHRSKVDYADAFSPLNWISLVGCGIGMQFFIMIILGIVLPLFPQQMNEYSELINQSISGNLVLSIITTVICAPIAEECLFRGLVLKKLSLTMKFWVANIIQAVLFGILHLNIIQGIYAFFIGLACGFICQRFRTIWASIITHASLNLCGVLVGNLVPDSVGDTWWFALIISFVGVAFCGLCFYHIKRVRVEETFYPLEPVYPMMYEQMPEQQIVNGYFESVTIQNEAKTKA